MDGLEVLESLFDQKTLRILKLFIQEREAQFYLREVAKRTGVPPATTYRIIARLLRLEVIEQQRIKHFKLYRLRDNPASQFLESFLRMDRHALSDFVAACVGIAGLQSVVLHGKAQKDRANVLLIGEGIDNDTVKAIVGGIKERFRYTLSTLSLTREQFEQMRSMGLYAGEKKIIYSRTA